MEAPSPTARRDSDPLDGSKSYSDGHRRESAAAPLACGPTQRRLALRYRPAMGAYFFLLITVSSALFPLTLSSMRSAWSKFVDPNTYTASTIWPLASGGCTIICVALAIPYQQMKSKLVELWNRPRVYQADVLYELLEPVARYAKILVQMTIGVVSIVLIIRIALSARHDGFPNNLPGADSTIQVIAAGLAIAAAAELAYTLFTDGPDEAIDPLMLGLASALLFQLAKLKTLTSGAGIATILLVVSLGVLFAVRREFIEDSEGPKWSRRSVKRPATQRMSKGMKKVHMAWSVRRPVRLANRRR
jgi:hypothetical protein